MSLQAVLLPLFVQVILTFVIFFLMAMTRSSALSRGLDWRTIANREPNWPGRGVQYGNAFANQFELPILFYVLTLLAWLAKEADLLFVVLAWMFVLSRLAHAYVHVTSNHVPTRGALFGAGALVLMLMWIIFIVRVLLSL
ncbi:MAG TPA: MAPEG family protein [Rhodanobacteraceae bacterium]